MGTEHREHHPVDFRHRRTRRLLMLAVALTAFAFSHAFAATPKTESAVTGDTVTVADVFDDAGKDAAYVLAPAPAAGRVLVLKASDLARISDTLGLGWRPTTGVEQTVLRRVSNAIGPGEILAALRTRAAQDLGEQKFELELAIPALSLPVGTATDKSVRVEAFAYDAARGEFRATVSAASAPQATLRDVRGRLYPLVAVPVLKEPKRPGEVITAADLDQADIRAGQLAPTAIVSPDQLIGQTPRRTLTAQKPVSVADIQAPVLVKKGALVTVTLSTNALNLTTQAKALEDGIEGEPVRVMNLSSKQIISAVVAGPQAVRVLAAGTL